MKSLLKSIVVLEKGNRKHLENEPTVDFLTLRGSIKTKKKALSSRELHDFVAEGMAREQLDNI